ncbi:hypothetical protein [Streptomyces sp. NPDC056796]|uniref:hypothetical protein n=1 Tax=unclassified Streptomyces TaxID=2593676 RepID=UPI0036A9C2D7
MADEQHEWLDADVAELLLRGGSVEPVGDHARTEAGRLEAALLALRTPAPARDELPGEAAALAAFREASRGGERAGATGTAGHADQRNALDTVRIGAVSTAAPRRRPRWTRPVRLGLAVSLAGCALGGVAVAAGTGMLPAPFGGHGSPVPATSVSAAASPEELGAEVPDAGTPSPLPSLPSGTPSPPAAPDAPDGGTPGSDGRSGQDEGGATARERGGQDSGDSGTQDGTDGRRSPEGSAAEVYKKSVRACRGYREGTLSQKEKRRLLELADGEANLDRFCDRLLGPDSRGGDDGQGDEDGDGDEGGGGDKGGDGEGVLPSITFREPSRESAPDDASQGGTNRRPTRAPQAGPSSTLTSATR